MYSRLFIICLPVIFLGCSSKSIRLDGQFSSTQGYVVKGEGNPSVVFESNLGDGHEMWSPIITEVSKKNKVYAYSRNFGNTSSGKSSGFANVRTSRDVAISLRNRLRSSKVDPPYILVGHSYGSLYVLKFSELYRKEVAGIILVDGRPAGFTNYCKQKRLGNCEIPFLVQSLRAPNEQMEIRGIPESETITPGADKFGSLPITVITATVPEKNYTQSYQEHWIRSQETFARSLQNGKFVTALGSGHYVHKHRPDLVVQEIRSMISRVR